MDPKEEEQKSSKLETNGHSLNLVLVLSEKIGGMYVS
jgi:hypothetical protein